MLERARSYFWGQNAIFQHVLGDIKRMARAFQIIIDATEHHGAAQAGGASDDLN